MRKLLLRIAVGGVTLILGVLLGSIHQKLNQTGIEEKANESAVVETFEQSTTQPITAAHYPENSDLAPFAIESFVDQNPNGNLNRLWERLGIATDSETFNLGGACGYCKAESFYYHLDDDSDMESVLRIDDAPNQSTRYLIFDPADKNPYFIGHIDGWGKYRPSTHGVLLSGGQAWLVVQSQAANGSGLAAYIDTIYQVKEHKLIQVASYFSEVTESGVALQPDKRFIGRPVSCSLEDGRTIVTILYTIHYSVWLPEKEFQLFTKQQTAVIVSREGRGEVLDSDRSEMSTLEYNVIYSYHSMTRNDFLKYNRAELREMTFIGANIKKQQWLRDYLDTCEDSVLKRELMELLE